MAEKKKSIKQKSITRHSIIRTVGSLFYEVENRVKIAHGISMKVNKIVGAMKK
jgi:hypothetical protein